ncbi:MAG: 4-phosphopantetheinyl transferase [Actinomycetota bacterium]|jgi:4'-phosphopantetheinyl transferase|nr:4-phosphopantetheinyl transferase [Actinomycetota bacterium]
MIELFWGDLDVSDDELDVRRTTLSPEEFQRAGRYRFERDRRRFVARRGMVRAILARRLDCSPGALDLVVDEWGKPFVPGTGTHLSFNLSHSQSMAVVAVSDGRPVGVDLEVARPDPGDADVARHFFTAAEMSGLMKAPDAEFGMGFLRVWTRKEAWVKAKGQGLSIPLDSFDVSSGPGARLLDVRSEPGERARWLLADVSGRYHGVEVVACVAATGADWNVGSVEWSPQPPAAIFS